MKCNIGNTDRMIRFVIGFVIVVLGVYFQSWWGLIGIIPLATAFLRFCPLYVPMGITTDKPGADKK
jgi:hypothetical protein